MLCNIAKFFSFSAGSRQFGNPASRPLSCRLPYPSVPLFSLTPAPYHPSLFKCFTFSIDTEQQRYSLVYKRNFHNVWSVLFPTASFPYLWEQGCLSNSSYFLFASKFGRVFQSKTIRMNFYFRFYVFSKVLLAIFCLPVLTSTHESQTPQNVSNEKSTEISWTQSWVQFSINRRWINQTL